MVKGAIDNNGVPVLAGSFRETPCYSSGTNFSFTSPEHITPQLEKCLAAFNKGPKDFHAIALFTERFLSIHPFEDGNGRLTRLLVAWLLMRCIKLPWIVPIPHGKKAKQRFMTCLLRAGRDNHDLSWLKYLLIEACWESLQAFQALSKSKAGK